MKDWHMFSTKNPDSYMMLGLLNTLANNGTITKNERDDIYSLGYCVENFGKIRDAKKVKALLEELKKQFINKDPDFEIKPPEVDRD